MRGAEQVFQIDISIHLAPHPIGDRVDHFRPVLRRINMDTEWALAERCVHHTDDCFCHVGRVGIGRLKGGETLQRLVNNAGIRAGFIFGCSMLIGWSTAMREVVGPFRESAGYHNRRLDSPQSQFGGIGNRQRIHRCFGREIGRKERRRAAARRRRTDPHKQSLGAYELLSDPAQRMKLIDRMRRTKGWSQDRAEKAADDALTLAQIAQREKDGTITSADKANASDITRRNPDAAVMVKEAARMKNERGFDTSLDNRQLEQSAFMATSSAAIGTAEIAATPTDPAFAAAPDLTASFLAARAEQLAMSAQPEVKMPTKLVANVSLDI